MQAHKSPLFTSSFSGTGRIKIPARPIQSLKGASTHHTMSNDQIGTVNLMKDLSNIVTIPKQSNMANLHEHRLLHSATPVESRPPRVAPMTRSRSVGPTIIPPPADASFYPLVTDLSKGLRSFQVNDRNDFQRIQALAPKKFILGRVASNEDICIETETPFAFSIAAKGKKICIAKVASADDLQRPRMTNQLTSDVSSSDDIEEGIPVSLRLTFGSTPNVSTTGLKAPLMRESPLHKTFRSVLQIDMTGRGKNQSRPIPRPTRNFVSGSSFQNNLPSLPKPPNRSPLPVQTANFTFFEQKI